MPTRVPLPFSGSFRSTFDIAIGASFSTMPPLMFFWGLARVARLMRLPPSTTTRPAAGITRSTLPSAPRSFPARTTTRSPRRTRIFPVNVGFFFFMASDDFGRERDDLHELLLPQLPSDRPEYAGADRLLVVVDEDRRVVVEADVASVPAPLLADRPDDDRLHDLPLLHGIGRVGIRLLDGHGDHVACPAVIAGGAALQT